jgi:predicted phage terminase large subunit-like protein
MINPQVIGAVLLQSGFKVWFLYMFKLIEGRPFIVEAIHEDLFNYYQLVYNGDKIRCNINIPPRAGKTTLQEYFTVFTLTNNPRSNIIYTSYSQTLLTDIANKVATILEHPAYKAMYPYKILIEDCDSNPVDDFWRDYLQENDKKNTYSSRKITTYAGGTVLFASIGSQITGYGCGVRGSKKFSGFLAIDDAQKPSDSRSQVLRDKVIRYYEETLLSRLNNPNTPIVNIQQRLHLEDLSGVLKEKYNFDTLCKPLIDDNGICQIPSQYTKERLEELQQNNYVFSAQYQQQPIILGGQVIKRDYFRYYPTVKEYNYKRIIIAADTAMKTKEYNDYSVFIAGGITPENQLHVLDMIRGKWEAPELEKMAVMFWNKFKRNPVTGLTCNGLYIEDKASGIGLIQGLKAKYGIPVMGLKADTDKLTHVETMLPYMESGQVYLPENENYGFNPDLLAECEAFSRDMSHSHDDIVDALCYLIQEGIAQLTVSLLDYFRD